MRIPAPHGRRRARIEIIPLIDIMFFLLATFVMVSLSMVKNRAIPVKLPVAATGQPQAHRATTTVTIDPDGLVYLDREPMALEELSERLEARAGAEPDLQVVVHGDEAVEFGQAIHVLDEIRRLGITRIAIQTRPPRPPEP